MVGPPGMEPDKLAYLQKVWKDILTDPAVIAEGKKTNHGFDYASGPEVKKAISAALESLTPDELKKVNEVLFKKHGS